MEVQKRRILIIVQNLPLPFDRRVWLECQALVSAGYRVAAVCMVIATVLLPLVVVASLLAGRGPVVPVVAVAGWACFLFLFVRLRTRVRAIHAPDGGED